MADQWFCPECNTYRDDSEMLCGRCAKGTKPPVQKEDLPPKGFPPILWIVLALALIAVIAIVCFILIDKPSDPDSIIVSTVPTSVTTEKTTVTDWFMQLEIAEGEELNIPNHEEQQLTAVVTPAEKANTPVSWNVDNKEVLSVSETGLITALSEGTAVVTAAAGALTAEIIVTVRRPIPVEELSFRQGSSASIPLVDTAQSLAMDIVPPEAAEAGMMWKSSAPDIAAIDALGNITAKKLGTTIIAVSAGGKIASCEVTVRVPVPVESVSIDQNNLSLVIDSSETLSVTILPENADYDVIEWSSSDPSAASVNDSGQVFASEVGTASITAAAGGKSDTITVTVSLPVPVSGVSLSRSALTMGIGTSQTLTATVSPFNAVTKVVTWSSSNTAVATVNDGRVYANGQGTAKITANCDGKTAVCSVTVNSPVTGVSINQRSMSTYEGASGSLSASVLPSSANNRSVTWKSGNPFVIAMMSDGRWKALNKGQATIMVTTAEGGYKDSITITVY